MGKVNSKASDSSNSHYLEDAQKIIRDHCTNNGCHTKKGSAGFEATGDLNHLQSLIDFGESLIVPGDSKNSVLYQQIKTGNMPLGGNPLSNDQLKAVAQWIDSLDASSAVNPNDYYLSLGKRDDLIKADLTQLQKDRKDTDKIRYLTLSGGVASTPADQELVIDAVNKMLNHLSWKKTVTLAEQVPNSNGLLLRVNLEDYGIDPAAWDQMTQAYFYPTSEDSQVTKKTGSTVPVIRADWFVFESSKNGNYQNLLGIPNGIDDLFSLFGKPKRRQTVATDESRVSHFNRRIHRWENKRGQFFYISDDFNGEDGAKNLFSNPLSGAYAGGEYFYELPNGARLFGLEAFRGTEQFNPSDALSGNNYKTLAEAPNEIVVDSNRPDGIVRNPLSCFNCHSGGELIPVGTHVYDYLQKNPSGLNADIIEAAQSVYTEPSLFEQTARKDAKAYQDFLRQCGVDPSAPDPINQVVSRYENNVQGINFDLETRDLPKKGTYGDKQTETLQSIFDTSGRVSRQSIEEHYKAAREEALVKKSPKKKPTPPAKTDTGFETAELRPLPKGLSPTKAETNTEGFDTNLANLSPLEEADLDFAKPQGSSDSPNLPSYEEALEVIHQVSEEIPSSANTRKIERAAQDFYTSGRNPRLIDSHLATYYQNLVSQSLERMESALRNKLVVSKEQRSDLKKEASSVQRHFPRMREVGVSTEDMDRYQKRCDAILKAADAVGISARKKAIKNK